MTWSNFVNRLEITARRRGLATAVVYGLSLAVRFTSAAGEEVEIPAPLPTTRPMMSVMTAASSRWPYQDWALNAQPMVFRPGWPLGSAGCRTGM